MDPLRRLTDAWETREAELQLETYKQYAGLGASEARMEALGEEIGRLAQQGLATTRRREVPDLLWLGMVGAAHAREYTKLANDTYRIRNEAVKVSVAGEDVTLNNVRLFNHKHLREAPLRRQAFDGLMEKAAALTPTLRARFDLSAKVWGEHGLTPLDVYLVEERLDLATLERTVADSARRAKPAFQEAMDIFAPEVLGRPFEAFDDMYVFRHAIFDPVDKAFAGIDLVGAFRKVGTHLGFAVDGVGIDGETRPGKFSSPVCFGIRVPGDVRVLYQRTSPVSDLESFYHEMGHAMHFITVGKDRAFHERRLIPNGVAEIFSTLFEELSMDPLYMKEDLGLPDDVVDEVLRRRRFMELYFLVFYGANSLHKIHFWKDALWKDLEAADEAYADLSERCMGVRLPGIYWQTHHVLSMSDMYAPSYLLANIRKSEMIAMLQRRFGRRWWRDPEAGAVIRSMGTEPGASIDLDAFSTLDLDAYLRPVLDGRSTA